MVRMVVEGDRPLLVRSGKELKSAYVGDLSSGTRVNVFETASIEDGVVRARIECAERGQHAWEHGSRADSGHLMRGWVTFSKEHPKEVLLREYSALRTHTRAWTHTCTYA